MIGNNFFLNILKKIEGISVSDNQRLENDGNIWKGLFIDFEYNGQKFRWQLKDNRVYMYEKGESSHCIGDENKPFNDAESLKKELDHCCAEQL